MRIRRISALAAVLALSGATGALADDTKKLVSIGNWEAYAYTDAGGKVCYAAARADRTQGGDKDRAGTAIAITHRAKSPNEVSLLGAYGFKKDSEAEIQVGGMKHAFFTKGNSAWAKDAGADKSIIASLSKGKEVQVRATASKGASVNDSISLKGFTEALAAIDKACSVKR